MGALFACTSCLGQADGPLIDAARLGIWLLLAVTACIQGGFVAFFLYLRKRARLARTNQAATSLPAGIVGGVSAR